mmetsp:Transcript_865/g.2177  ORF Transcript_865/g.2177 Transcript_865/m.2177 type:complete len:358 (+) Transcript_865:64-1137(+)
MDESQDGPELFRNVVRLLPSANVEDYYKNGKWLKETLLIDAELLEAHRKESGAPEPPEPDEVQVPALPGEMRETFERREALRPPLRAPSGRPDVRTSASRLTPAPPKGPPPPSAIAAQRGSTSAATRPAAPSSELTMMSDFIAKWQLEPTRAKLLLARLPYSRRHAVIKQFEHRGPAATEAFEKYVKSQAASVGTSRPLIAPSSSPSVSTNGHAPLARPSTQSPAQPRTFRAPAKEEKELRPTPKVKAAIPSRRAPSPSRRVLSPSRRAPSPPRRLPEAKRQRIGAPEAAPPQSVRRPPAPTARGSIGMGSSLARPSPPSSRPPSSSSARAPVRTEAAKPSKPSKPGDLIASLLGGM